MACNCFQIDNAAPSGTALSRAWIGKGCCTSASALYTWLAGRAPFFYKNGCGGVKNIKGTSSLSVHSEGRAFDVSLRDPNHPWQRQFMWDRLNQMVEHGCILGLQRIIFNGRIWDMNAGFNVTGPAGWRRFTGSQNHNDHAHVEVCRMSCSRVSSDVVNYVLGIRTPQPSASVGTPGSGAGDNAGGASTGTPPAAVVPVAPSAPPLASTAPVWVDSSICGQCGITGFTAEEIVQEEIVAVRLVCGGSGGYCVDKRSGRWCGSGLVREWGQSGGSFGGSVVDVQTYGLDLYALVNTGSTQTIRKVSNSILTTYPLPDCGAFNGPWSRLTVANNGTILLSNSANEGGGYQMCGFEVPRLSGSLCCGAVSTPPRSPIRPDYPIYVPPPYPGGALIAYDSRMWDGTTADVTPGTVPGTVPNLGTTGQDNYQLGTRPAPGGSCQTGLKSWTTPLIGSPDFSIPGWAELGGTLQSGPWTVVGATRSIEPDGPGYPPLPCGGGFFMSIGGFYFSLSNFPGPPYDTTYTEMGIGFNAASPPGWTTCSYTETVDGLRYNKLWSAELSMITGNPSSGIIRIGNTIVDTSTGGDHGTFYDNLFDGSPYGPMYSTEWVGGTQAYPAQITVGDPWAVVGYAVIRGILTDDDREAWRAYFLD